MLTSRKRKSRFEDYADQLDRDPNDFDRRRQFLIELQLFYRKKWSVPIKVPHVNGCPIDVYRLYNTVTMMGGWQKVSNGGRWPDVAAAVDVESDATLASEHAVKLIYMRYLSKFELAQTMGGDVGDFDFEELGGGGDSRGGAGTRSSTRGRAYMTAMWSVGGGHGGAAGDCPYSRGSLIHSAFRADYGLGPLAGGRQQLQPDGSLSAGGGDPYRRVVCSLLSGLPNEVDFALNVCTLLSHPGPRLIRLERTPDLVHCLLAHAGIFGDDAEGTSLRALYTDDWVTKTGRRFVDFWQSGVSDAAVRRLLVPLVTKLDDGDNHTVPPLSSNTAVADEKESNTMGSDFMLHGARLQEYDLKQPVSWRIYQVASILRNLSFELVNRSTLAASTPLIRFLFVCIHSRWPSLQTMALDILSNVAPEIQLENFEPSLVELLFRTLSSSLQSEDKLHVIRALEIAAGICQKERNVNHLSSLLDGALVRRVMDLITVRDIMMCVYALECLYQVSELGTPACQLIVTKTRAVEALVNLTTVEAVSFGRSGLSGMKVVEYHGGGTPHTAMLPHQQQFRPPHPPPTQQIPTASSDYQIPSHQPLATTDNFVQPSSSYPFAATSMQQPQPPRMTSSATPISPRLPPPNVPVGHSQQDIRKPQTSTASDTTASSSTSAISIVLQQDEKVEQLTRQWLQSNLQPVSPEEPPVGVSRGQLYATYVDEMRRLHGSLAVSVHTFTELMKGLFPTCVLRNLPSERAQLMQVEGLRFIRIAASGAVKTTVVEQQKQQQQIPTDAPPIQQQQSVLQRMLADGDSATKAPPTDTSAQVKYPALTQRLSATSDTSGGAQRNVPNGSANDDLSRGATSGTPDSLMSYSSSGDEVTNNSVTDADVKLPKNCKLEVCAAAQEARGIIPESVGAAHEASIVRIENTRIATKPVVTAAAPPSVAETLVVASKLAEKLPLVNGNASPPVATGVAVPHQNGRNGIVRIVRKRRICETMESDDNGEQTMAFLPGDAMDLNDNNNGGYVSNETHARVALPMNPTDTNANTAFSAMPQRQPSPAINIEDGSASGALESINETTESSKKSLASRKRSAAAARAAVRTPNTRSKTSGGGTKRATRTPSKSRASDDEDSGNSDEESPVGGVATGGNETQQLYQQQQPSASCTNAPMQMPPQMIVQQQQPPQQPPPFVLKYMCEWNGCGRSFSKAQAVSYHCYHDHIDETTTVCKWPSCDQTVRLRWSLVTHVQDHHCSEAVLRAAAVRRYELSVRGTSSVVEPRRIVGHPGYSKHAAIEAIRRHAFANLHKELTEESEGPVTKSIRLTSCLILRNLARHSPEARRQLRTHEGRLSWLALSRLEGSTALAQCLVELADGSVVNDEEDELEVDSPPSSTSAVLVTTVVD